MYSKIVRIMYKCRTQTYNLKQNNININTDCKNLGLKSHKRDIQFPKYTPFFSTLKHFYFIPKNNVVFFLGGEMGGDTHAW